MNYYLYFLADKRSQKSVLSEAKWWFIISSEWQPIYTLLQNTEIIKQLTISLYMPQIHINFLLTCEKEIIMLTRKWQFVGQAEMYRKISLGFEKLLDWITILLVCHGWQKGKAHFLSNFQDIWKLHLKIICCFFLVFFFHLLENPKISCSLKDPCNIIQFPQLQ